MSGNDLLKYWIELHLTDEEFAKRLQKFICTECETCALCPLAGCECCIDTQSFYDYLTHPISADTIKSMYRVAKEWEEMQK